MKNPYTERIQEHVDRFADVVLNAVVEYGRDAELSQEDLSNLFPAMRSVTSIDAAFADGSRVTAYFFDNPEVFRYSHPRVEVQLDRSEHEVLFTRIQEGILLKFGTIEISPIQRTDRLTAAMFGRRE